MKLLKIISNFFSPGNEPKNENIHGMKQEMIDKLDKNFDDGQYYLSTASSILDRINSAKTLKELEEINETWRLCDG